MDFGDCKSDHSVSRWIMQTIVRVMMGIDFGVSPRLAL